VEGGGLKWTRCGESLGDIDLEHLVVSCGTEITGVQWVSDDSRVTLVEHIGGTVCSHAFDQFCSQASSSSTAGILHTCSITRQDIKQIEQENSQLSTLFQN
jgi:imidazole glycerol phosphate synthase subunit HisF